MTCAASAPRKKIRNGAAKEPIRGYQPHGCGSIVRSTPPVNAVNSAKRIEAIQSQRMTCTRAERSRSAVVVKS